MGMGCGMTMVKYILFIFNLLCALCGIAILAVGIAFYLKVDEFDKAFENMNVIAVPVVFVIFGSIIFIIAFFGCCGAIKDAHCMILTYSVFLMLLLLAQIVLGVIVFVYIGDIQKAANVVLEKLWDNRDQEANKEFWNTIQSGLECCGYRTPLDWIPNTPLSCCKPGAITCVAGVNGFTRACGATLDSFIQTAGHTLGAVALGVAAIELVGFIFACCLANNIRNEERRYA